MNKATFTFTTMAELLKPVVNENTYQTIPKNKDKQADQ